MLTKPTITPEAAVKTVITQRKQQSKETTAVNSVQNVRRNDF